MKPDAMVTIISINTPNAFVVPLFDLMKVFNFLSSCIFVVLDYNMSFSGHIYNVIVIKKYKDYVETRTKYVCKYIMYALCMRYT